MCSIASRTVYPASGGCSIRRTDQLVGIAIAQRSGTFQAGREARVDGVPGIQASAIRAPALEGGGSPEPSHLPQNHSCQNVRCATISAMECGAVAMRRPALSPDAPSRAGKRRNVRMVVDEEVASVHVPIYSTRGTSRVCDSLLTCLARLRYVQHELSPLRSVRVARSRDATGEGTMRRRSYATNAAMPNRTSVIAAELVSPRAMWNTVAETITIMIPTAAWMTRRGRPGRPPEG